MLKKKLAFVIVSLVFACAAVAQQRPFTSTYQYNLLLLNPAYAGSLDVLSVIGVHRTQWVNLPGAPKYSALSAHNSFAGNRIGTGFFLTQDNIGVHEDLAFYSSYAYKIPMKFGILAMGISGGFNSRMSDFTQIDLLDGNDPVFNGTNGGVRRRFSPNFGTGVYFANPNFYLGVSIPYILENKTIDDLEFAINGEESRETRYYYVTSGVIFPISSSIKLAPAFVIRAQEESRPAWDISTNLIFDEIAYIGLNVRNSGEVAIMGQMILNENFRVGYAYDFITDRDRARVSPGSHEVLLNYRIKLKNTRKNPQCPVYF
ncbi:MAG: type IX secretion system membrane protein PorP/SprF [Cyclobacteriaceae bacterium]